MDDGLSFSKVVGREEGKKVKRLTAGGTNEVWREAVGCVSGRLSWLHHVGGYVDLFFLKGDRESGRAFFSFDYP